MYAEPQLIWQTYEHEILQPHFVCIQLTPISFSWLWGDRHWPTQHSSPIESVLANFLFLHFQLNTFKCCNRRQCSRRSGLEWEDHEESLEMFSTRLKVGSIKAFTHRNASPLSQNSFKPPKLHNLLQCSMTRLCWNFLAQKIYEKTSLFRLSSL